MSKWSSPPDFTCVLWQRQSAQFGFLDVFAGNILGQEWFAIRVYFGVRPLPKF